jgi:hypothetical protein
MITHTGIRRYKRHAIGERNLRAKTLIATDAELLNISTTGACIKTRQIPHKGGTHYIRLESEGIDILLQCSVKWQDQDIDVKKSSRQYIPVYRTGITFHQIPSDSLVKLKDFMRVSGSPYVQRLSEKYRSSALRFSVRSNEKAVFYQYKPLSVKKISHGGMLVSSDYQYRVEKNFPMVLFLPNNHLPVKFQGRVASCVDMPHWKADSFDIGIQFIDMPALDRARLSSFIYLL